MEDKVQKDYDYRQGLISTETSLRHSYDKLVVAIATGTVWISVFFVDGREMIVSERFIFWGWFFSILSIVSVLFSVYLGIKAHRKAVEQRDKNPSQTHRLGGNFSLLSSYFHNSALAFLIVGMCFICAFVFFNIR